MSKLKALLANPTARLIGRALLAGIGYFVSTLRTGGPIGKDALIAAAVGAAWAAIEYVTPLNGILGYFKLAEKIEPKLAVVAPPTPLPPAA